MSKQSSPCLNIFEVVVKMSNYKVVGDITSDTHNHTLRYKWKIADYDFYTDHPVRRRNVRLRSPKFEKQINDIQFEWQLWLYPECDEKSIRHELKENLSISLYNLIDCVITAVVSFSVINPKGMKVIKKETIPKKTYDTKLMPEANWKVAEFFEQKFIDEKKKGVFHKGFVTILCEIKILEISVINDTTLKNFSLWDQEDHFDVKAERLRQFDRYELMSGDMFSDLLICVDSQVLRAHRCVVAKSSLVLGSKFKSQIRQKEKCLYYTLNGFRYQVIVAMLHFIYTGKIDVEVNETNIKNFFPDLFYAAALFCVVGLRRMCLNVLAQNLRTNNVVEIINFCDRICETPLKLKAIKFITDHLNKSADKTKIGMFKNKVAVLIKMHDRDKKKNS